MLGVALLRVAKLGISPGAHQQMEKEKWYIYTMEYYSAIKKN
jgi:hypothetical protein